MFIYFLNNLVFKIKNLQRKQYDNYSKNTDKELNLCKILIDFLKEGVNNPYYHYYYKLLKNIKIKIDNEPIKDDDKNNEEESKYEISLHMEYLYKKYNIIEKNNIDLDKNIFVDFSNLRETYNYVSSCLYKGSFKLSNYNIEDIKKNDKFNIINSKYDSYNKELGDYVSNLKFNIISCLDKFLNLDENKECKKMFR